MRAELSIWFFAGVQFLLFGIIILLQGLWELVRPPLHPPVLHQLHPAIWWGALMAVAGIIYTAKFWPKHR